MRTRRNLIIFYVNDDELQLIEKKRKITGIISRSAYLRKVAIDGYVIHIDYSYMKEHTRQIRMIGIDAKPLAERSSEQSRLVIPTSVAT